MDLETLGEINKLYNFQEIIILCEIFESLSSYLQKMSNFNPKKSNSTSSFGSCANTSLAFDSQILLPKNERDIFKLIYDIVKSAGIKEKKRVAKKISKVDENNQYGNAKTKPLPYGCIKNLKKSHPFMNLRLV